MKKLIPLLCLLLRAGYTQSSSETRRNRCGEEGMENFPHLFAGYHDNQERCKDCYAAIATFRHKGFEYMYEEFKKMCNNYLSQYSPVQCIEMLDMYKEEIRFLVADLKVDDQEACRFVLSCGNYNNSVYNWEFKLETEALESSSDEEKNEFEPFSVFHLTDTHISPQYTVGSTYDCLEELCCSDRMVENATSSTAVGPYGDIRGISYCDLPIRTLKSLLRNSKQREFTYVYLTGDFVPHTSFNYSLSRIISEIAEQSDLIADSLKGHKIFPCIGNHDDYPSFLFPTHKMHAGNYSIDKSYNALWEIWGHRWIPAKAEKTWKKGGYYTVLAQPGLRLFVLNTIYCYKLNWWLTVNPRDPEEQLEWLAKGLEKAAKKGERVHILGHVPPGVSDCKNEWAEAYQKIVSRFRNVIAAQFFGHQHWDMFSVDFDPDTEEPVGVQFAAPSATTYLTGYPTYRIIHFGSKAEIIDMDTYLLNITNLNTPFLEETEDLKPDELKVKVEELDKNDTSHEKWQLAYSYKSFYDLDDFTPSSFVDLIDRFRKDDELLARYYRAYYQHRAELQDIKCHIGSCAAYYDKPIGSRHDVTCEMYSTGTKQQKDCKDYYKKLDPPGYVKPTTEIDD